MIQICDIYEIYKKGLRMDLVSKVNFDLTTKFVVETRTPDGRFLGLREYEKVIDSLEQFREFIASFTDFAKSGVDKTTYSINLARRVTITDMDDRKFFKSVIFPDMNLSIILSTTDKLLYASDIEPMFNAEFPNFLLKNKKFIDMSRPIYLEYFDGQDAKYRPLAQDGYTNDIVVDTALNQIWPVKTGQPPVALTQLMSRTIEKVR
ncbi:MAG: hypothetical protein J5620_01325 [Alphaproteobacteria bacterium]|nr:hypothetical protein [Alphaproteobacteria bacterium]